MSPAISPAVAERAVQWLVDLQSDDASPTTLEQWRHWRAQTAEHEQAWQRIAAFSERFGHLGEAHHATIAHAALTSGQASGLNRRQAIKTLALLIAAGSAAWTAKDSGVWRDWTADYHTAVGERRNVLLADGTQVQLNTDSAINVRYDQDRRQINLLNGEIIIATARDPSQRPFWVDTAQGSMQGLGSRFSLHQQSGFCRVAVTEGSVALHPAARPQPQTLLKAGQQALLMRDQVGPLRSIDSSIDAWTRGIIVASDQRLADFVRELDRYRPGHLGCSSALAEVRVSGTFPLADTDRILDTLGKTLNLEVKYYTRFWVSLAPRKDSV